MQLVRGKIPTALLCKLDFKRRHPITSNLSLANTKKDLWCSYTIHLPFWTAVILLKTVDWQFLASGAKFQIDVIWVVDQTLCREPLHLHMSHARGEPVSGLTEGNSNHWERYRKVNIWGKQQNTPLLPAKKPTAQRCLCGSRKFGFSTLPGHLRQKFHLFSCVKDCLPKCLWPQYVIGALRMPDSSVCNK